MFALAARGEWILLHVDRESGGLIELVRVDRPWDEPLEFGARLMRTRQVVDPYSELPPEGWGAEAIPPGPHSGLLGIFVRAGRLYVASWRSGTGAGDAAEVAVFDLAGGRRIDTRSMSLPADARAHRSPSESGPLREVADGVELFGTRIGP